MRKYFFTFDIFKGKLVYGLLDPSSQVQTFIASNEFEHKMTQNLNDLFGTG